jgi:hypothetical protein
MRQCKTCLVVKPDEAFAEIGFTYPNRPRYRRHVCRECFKAANRGVRCRVCRRVKAPSEFHSDKRNKSGLQSTCKACAHARKTQWIASHADQYRRYQKMYRLTRARAG